MKQPIKKRLKDKFGKIPKWAEDFSIESTKDATISRRDFIRFLSIVSFGLFTGTLGVYLRSLMERPDEPVGAAKIADLNTIAVGESRNFVIPGKREPALMVRLAEDRYVAYGQKCTHLQCPVLWNKDSRKIECPCHNGAFDVETGNVLYGPPERALPQLELEIKEDGIYYIGVKNGKLV